MKIANFNKSSMARPPAISIPKAMRQPGTSPKAMGLIWRSKFLLLPATGAALAGTALLGSLLLSGPAFKPQGAVLLAWAGLMPSSRDHQVNGLRGRQAKRQPLEGAVSLSPIRPKTKPMTLAQRQHRYWPLVRDLAREEGVDPALVMAVVDVESKFRHRATSGKGAMGLMQIVPGTAEELGLDDPFNPRQNLRAGVRYLAQLKRIFDDDLVLTLAAYNAGPTKVLELGGIPDHEETRQFVVKVLGKIDHFRQKFLSLAQK